jgi:hypothetical protein
MYDSQVDHVWTNVPTQQCISGVLEAYWTDHRQVYFSFKLLNYVPQYRHVNKKNCSNTKAETTQLAACFFPVLNLFRDN